MRLKNGLAVLLAAVAFPAAALAAAASIDLNGSWDFAFVESVASPDDWAEVELPLSAFTRGKGASGGERKFVAITALIFGEQANLDYAYREVRFETNPQKEESDR